MYYFHWSKFWFFEQHTDKDIFLMNVGSTKSKPPWRCFALYSKFYNLVFFVHFCTVGNALAEESLNCECCWALLEENCVSILQGKGCDLNEVFFLQDGAWPYTSSSVLDILNILNTHFSGQVILKQAIINWQVWGDPCEDPLSCSVLPLALPYTPRSVSTYCIALPYTEHSHYALSIGSHTDPSPVYHPLPFLHFFIHSRLMHPFLVFLFDHWTFKTKALQCSERWRTMQPTTQCHMPEDLHPE